MKISFAGVIASLDTMIAICDAMSTWALNDVPITFTAESGAQQLPLMDNDFQPYGAELPPLGE